MKRLSPSVVEADLSYESAEGYKRDFLLISDVHWDSKHCDRGLLREHLEEAKVRDAPVFIFGDFFDAMQGTRDPRAMKGDLLHELDNPAYFDRMIDKAVEWLGPFVDRIALVSKGNHELSVTKHYGTDLTERLVHAINQAGGECFSGGYEGWVLFRFYNRTPSGRSSFKTLRLYYNHGSGGSSPVTKGTIKASRRAAYLPDADIVATGHIHESWQVEYPRVRINSKGRVSKDVQTHIQLAAYVDDRSSGTGTSWPIMKEFSPKPLGGWWLRFSVRNHDPIYNVVRAK